MVTAAASGSFALGGDMDVYRLGFGAMRITGRGVWGPPEDPGEALDVLRRAVALDVNFIDTAESYGPKVSEALIAEALHPYPPGLVIATKGGYDRPGPGDWVENAQPQRLAAELEGSLRRLRVERIDLYQLHRVDPSVRAEDQFGVLQRARDQGKIRHVGLSEVSVEQIERAREFFPVVSVQNRYNLEDREWEPVVEHCEREGIAFIPWYPLGVGRIGERGGPISEVARRHRATRFEIAIAWLLHRSPVMLPIPGTSRVAHLEENVAAAGIQLTAEDLKLLG